MKRAAWIGLLLLASCEVGPDYVRPPVATPNAYKETGDWQKAQPQDTFDRGAWWSAYKDPILSGLEEKVNVSNQNLKAAEASYRVAVALVEETRSSLFPTLSLDASTARSGNLKSHAANQYNINTTASWVPDVWGSIRRTLEGDVANAQASAADLANARLAAQAELATDYFDLRIQDELKRLLQETADNDAKALQIVQNQYKAGIVARADVLSAQTQVENVKAQLINADVKRAQFEHAIAVLIGVPPAQFIVVPDDKLATIIPNIPSDMPSLLLQRRPDIASAERQMASANAQIGVETAAYFPNFTLSASFGYGAAALSKLFQASNALWSVGPSLAETIFDAGARDARVAQAEAGYDQTVALYRQTVLTAFQQVEDNLAALRILADQAKMEEATVADAREAERLTFNQYKEGTVPYSSVLTAQSTTLSNEQTALSVYDSRLTASVALIQALGGGWDAASLPAP